MDKTKEVVANICKLKNTQEKLILFLQGRIQHLLTAVPIHLSRYFARQHDEAISEAVAATFDLDDLTDRDKLRKISKHTEYGKNLEFLFISGFMRLSKTRFPTSTTPCNTQFKESQGLDAN